MEIMSLRQNDFPRHHRYYPQPTTTLKISKFTNILTGQLWQGQVTSSDRWHHASIWHNINPGFLEEADTNVGVYTLSLLFWIILFSPIANPLSYTLKGDIFTPKTLLYSKQTRRGEKQQYWIHCGREWDLSTQGKVAVKEAQKEG